MLHGAPVQTYDIDIVYSQTAENIARLLAVLTSMDAICRIQPECHLHPNVSHLSGNGYLNLNTRFGPVDLLAIIGNGLTYEDLLPRSRQILIADAVRIKVLSLGFIMALKEQLGNEKDLAVLPILRQTARELKRRQQ